MKSFFIIFCAMLLFSSATAFTVEPKRIAYVYSQEQLSLPTIEINNETGAENRITYSYSEKFSLPVIEIKNDSQAKHLNIVFECEEGFDCLKDYCNYPANLFLMANEVKQIQIVCTLQPLEERILVGRALFLPQDSNSSDQNVLIELIKGTGNENKAIGLSFEALFGKDQPLLEFNAGEHHIIVLKSHLLIVLCVGIVLFLLKGRD